jgi:hypothetical protein
MKPLSVRRYATFWDCDCDFVATGKQSIDIYEPLPTHAPKDAKPHCCYADRIDFRNPKAKYNDPNYYYHENCKHINFERVSTELVLVKGTWYSLAGGRVEWIENENFQGWCMVWRAYKNSKIAYEMNVVTQLQHQPQICETLRQMISATETAK